MVKRANGSQSSDEECENIRDCVYFSTIVDIRPHVETHSYGTGQGKVCVGHTRLQVLLNDRYPTSTRRRSNGSSNSTTTGFAITAGLHRDSTVRFLRTQSGVTAKNEDHGQKSTEERAHALEAQHG